MKTIVKAAALVLAPMTAIALTAVPAAAQTKSGIAVVDLEEAVAKSSAFTTAMTQMQTTYKPQLDQINSRRTAIETAAGRPAVTGRAHGQPVVQQRNRSAKAVGTVKLAH